MENRIGFGKRFSAYSIDIIIILVLGLILSIIFPNQYSGNLSGYAGAENVNSSIITGIIGFMFFFYTAAVFYWLIEAFTGASPGKLLTGIKIFNNDRSNAMISTLFLRYGLKNIGFIFSFFSLLFSVNIIRTFGSILGLIIFIGYFFVLDKSKQTLHDKILKTAVYPKISFK